jgi:hypothetical protein
VDDHLVPLQQMVVIIISVANADSGQAEFRLRIE